MTRRRRLLIVVLAVLVGVPVLAAIGVGGYLRSGGLEREIEHRWIKRGLPGRLEIASLRLVGLNEAVVEGLRLVEPGQPALCEAARATITFDALDRNVQVIRIEGASGGLDAARLAFLRGIIRAEALHRPTRAPSPLRIEIRQGHVDLPGGLGIDGASVDIDALGAQSSSVGTALLAGRPVRVKVITARPHPDAPIVTTVELLEASVEPTAVLTAVRGLGVPIRIPLQVDDRLPGLVSLAGTRFSCDPESDTASGAVQMAWQGGTASARIDADPRRAELRSLAVRDARMGSIDGTLAIDRRTQALLLDVVAWAPGPGLPLPGTLSLTEAAKLLPGIQVRHPVEERRTSVAFIGPGRARLDVLFGGDAPVRMQASELPLTLVQTLLPAPLVIGGGHLETGSAVLAAGRPEISAKVRQARFLANGWSFGPIDGEVAAVAVPGAGLQISAVLENVGKLSFRGDAQSGSVGVDCNAVESLLVRLRGPVDLPDLSGRLALEAGFAVAAGKGTVRVERLELGGASLRLRGRDLVKELSARLRGQLEITPGAITTRLGGQLRSGQIRLPGSWLQVAARTPIFDVDLVSSLGQGARGDLLLRRAMVRSADAKGDPVPGGYSAQFEGSLSGESLKGRIVGVVDHADLQWIASLAVPGEVSVAGEGALACTAELEGGEVRRIDGSFLPLGADLDIERGRLRVDGITGSIRFSLGGGQKP